jgi:hypothetical protein
MSMSGLWDNKRLKLIESLARLACDVTRLASGCPCTRSACLAVSGESEHDHRLIAIALLFVRVPYANSAVRVFLQEQLQNALCMVWCIPGLLRNDWLMRSNSCATNDGHDRAQAYHRCYRRHRGIGFEICRRLASRGAHSLFSNFRFRGEETGSTVARDRFEERPSGKVTRRDADVGSTASVGSFI